MQSIAQSLCDTASCWTYYVHWFVVFSYHYCFYLLISYGRVSWVFVSFLWLHVKYLLILSFNRFRASHSVYYSWQHRRWDDGLLDLQHLWSKSQKQQARVVLTFAQILHLIPEYLLTGGGDSGGGCKFGKRISDADYLTVFQCNYVSILFSLRSYMIIERTMDGRTDGRRADVGSHRNIWPVVGQQ